jgi:hypothetical protein
MTVNRRTRVAVLGTLAEFHNEAIPYDLAALLELVANIDPDLLCLDITPEQWREQDFGKLPSEYRDALVPLATQTDIVVAPIGGKARMPNKVISGWRYVVINWLRGRIGALQRTSSGPDGLNQGWRHVMANYLYDVIQLLSIGGLRYKGKYNANQLTWKILGVVRRDPGTRVLVVVNVRYCHIIRERLRKQKDIEIAAYFEL